MMENKEDEIKFIKAKVKAVYARAKEKAQRFYSLLPISRQHPREVGLQYTVVALEGQHGK